MIEWIQNNPILTGVVVTAVLGIVGVTVRYAFKFGKWKGEVDNDRSSFNDFVAEIREDIKRILERLPRQTEGSASPIRLTELGQKVSTEIGAIALATQLVAELGPCVAGKEAFEIQEACLHFVEHEYEPTPEVDTLIGRVAYNNGLERRQVLRVIGLELRDLLLPD